MAARITFAQTLVTGVSRQLTNDEHWTLYYFEDHASKCPSCYNPVAVNNSGRQLCDDGRLLACSAAALFFCLGEDGHVYAEKEQQQLVRVEMPAKYEHVAGLFKAIQASRSANLASRSAILASRSAILARPRSLDGHLWPQDQRPLR